MTSSTQLKILVLMGGTSSERDISLVSGKSVLEALSSLSVNVEGFDLQKDIRPLIDKLESFKPHVVFNALHGPHGEDGAVQGLLELMGVPYTHSGIMASSIGMNKAMTREVLAHNNLPVAKGKVISPAELKKENPFPGTYVIKPIEEGSSYGVYILKASEESRRIEIAESWQYGDEILVEEFIAGLELTIGVLNDTALAVTEIRPKEGKEFYDFEAKYANQGSVHILPAPIDSALAEKLSKIAIQAHNALGCAGPTRCDFRYDPKTKQIGILELNTQPGMTSTSLLPEQGKFKGIPFPKLCLEIVLEALERRKLLKAECAEWAKLA